MRRSISCFELPLHRAAQRADMDAVMWLLSRAECEVDAAVGTWHSTALHVACEYGCIAIVKLLLDAGASLRRCRSYGSAGEVYTALHVAAMGGSSGVVELLVQRGADVHSLAEGRTALHLACKLGRLEAASALLQSGSDVNAVTENAGCTALHFASAEFDREELVKLLLSRNADVFAVNKYGRSALHYAWGSQNPAIVERILRAAGAFTSACSVESASEVQWDLREDIVKSLLNCQADINVRDSDGKTPIHWACFCGSLQIAETLLKCGADVNIEVLGYTPLQQAVKYDIYRQAFGIQVDLVELLLQFGADINVKDEAGLTPLTDFLSFFVDCDRKRAIAKHFAKHVAKMAALDLFVDQSNLQALLDHELSRDPFRACKAEIENMKKRFIGDSTVTFFDIFKKGPARLAYYMANESISNAFESGDFELEFPIYSENLRKQFDLGRERLDLLQTCDSVLNVSNLRYFPNVCMRQLKKSLTNDDLQNILKSAAAIQPQ